MSPTAPLPLQLNLDVLVDYTEWERGLWRAWFAREGDAALAASMGPHGDGRFSTVRDVVRHVFAAEKRYVERLGGRPLTDPASIPGACTALFEFGRLSRRELREFVFSLPAREWDVPAEHRILQEPLHLTPRKIVVHVLLHEVRHWAQVATVLRWSGRKVDFHDFLFSPVLGDPRAPMP